MARKNSSCRTKVGSNVQLDGEENFYAFPVVVVRGRANYVCVCACVCRRGRSFNRNELLLATDDRKARLTSSTFTGPKLHCFPFDHWVELQLNRKH